MKVIDGAGLIIGRVATAAAKAALLGEDVAVVNCEKLVITGSRAVIFARQRFLADLKGKPTKGRFYHTRPEFFVKRAIRGMLPRSTRGIHALKRIRCSIGVPAVLREKPHERVPGADVSKVTQSRHLSVEEICKHAGGTWQA